MDTSFISNVSGKTTTQVSALKHLKRRSAIALTAGLLSFAGLILLFLTLGPHNLAVAYMAYFSIYIPFAVLCIITSAVLLIANIITLIKTRVKYLSALVYTILGLLLSASFFIYMGATLVIHQLDPYSADFTSSSSACQSSAQRAENPYLTGIEEPQGSESYLIAYDAVCSYLEAYYHSSILPNTYQDFAQYIQSVSTKNNAATITVNSSTPNQPNIYNITTNRKCHSKTSTAISIWYRNPDKDNQLRCDSVEPYPKLDLYNLQSHDTKTWYTQQFTTANNRRP